MQDQPDSWHLGPFEWSLRASAAWAPAPAWWHNSLKMAEQRGHSMVPKRIKSSIGPEWAHEPTRSIQPQPPPNGHLVGIHSTPGACPNQGNGPPIAERKHEELPLTGGVIGNIDEHIAKHCLTSSSKDLRASEARLGGATLAMWTILQKLPHMHNRAQCRAQLFNQMQGTQYSWAGAHQSSIVEFYIIIITTIIELTPRACNQAKLGLKYGGLGLRSLAMHAQAAYIASLSTSLTPIQPSELTMQHLCDVIMVFNGKPSRKLASFDGASTVDKARLLAISAPQAHAWLRAQLSPKLGLDLLPNEVQALVKWWLGLPVFTDADACPHCSQTLDIHGHQALICHAGSDIVTRHNCFRDSFADFCHRACLAPELERGCGLTSTKDRTRPADVLVPNSFSSI
eukprot:Em0022g473a